MTAADYGIRPFGGNSTASPVNCMRQSDSGRLWRLYLWWMRDVMMDGKRRGEWVDVER